MNHPTPTRSPLTIAYPASLPVSERIADIRELIARHQVVIVAGETGSGKTTQLPKVCLELGRGEQAMIAHTQPRRLAARTVAARLAEELQTPLGEGVGYQVRFKDHTSVNTRLKLMTDGVLLAEIQSDRSLKKYDTIIIDEAHERSLNIDFLLGYLKLLLPRRPDLKVIITSATIDVERFSMHFDSAPVVEVSGRAYPVEMRYRPVEDLSDNNDQAEAVEAALAELAAEGAPQRGDVLVFLSGERDIRAVARQLRHSDIPNLEVLPLYARLSAREQNKIFDLRSRRGWRVVLATNVAETSLTVPGIHFVIDTGAARISRYSYRSKVQRLPIEAISQASANQRAGRCGRLGPGIAIRLYSEDDFELRDAFTEPEIQRTNLASVILQMLNLRLGDIERFPFVDAPDRRFINDGYKLLEELHAVEGKRLTRIGQLLVRLPVDPRMGRILLAANDTGCLREALTIVSALSIQDPRERPADKQQAADEKHRRFWHPESDFLAFVNLWNYLEEQRQALSGNQFRKLCQREFLSSNRVQEWRELHWQLTRACRQQGWRLNREPADYETIHRSLLAGLLTQIAQREEDKSYRGTRNRKLKIFPGSSLFKKAPPWIVAAELTETTQLYARCVAKIEPEWLLGINDALLKRHYLEPHWQARTGRVVAFRQTQLFGLTIQERKRVNYGPIDPVLSRELFIRAALVEERYRGKAAFFRHNRALIRDVTELENKARRRDLLISDELLYRFYDQRLPEEVISSRHLEGWLKKGGAERDASLRLNRDDVLAASVGRDTEAQFPDTWVWGELRLPLRYRFEPGHAADGVTLEVPVTLLNHVPEALLEWLVPGLLEEKCVALMKALPKQWRKQLVPVPAVAAEAAAILEPGNQPLASALGEVLRKTRGVEIPVAQWSAATLDDYYRMNIRVVDERGKTLGESRDFKALKDAFADRARNELAKQTEQRFESRRTQSWDFGQLPMATTLQQGAAELVAYPAVVDRGNAVEIQLLGDADEAELSSRAGLVRLISLAQQASLKPLRERLFQGNQVQLQLVALGQQRRDWVDDLIAAAVAQAYLDGRELPRDEAAFEAILEAGRARFPTALDNLEKHALAILASAAAIERKLKDLNSLTWYETVSDIRGQLQALLFDGFLTRLDAERLAQYPRYLQAVERRIDRLEGHYQRDRQLTLTLKALSEPLWQRGEPEEVIDAGRHPGLAVYRWMLEEFRVSLFAQELGTACPVSEKRLKRLWREIEAGEAPSL